MTVGATEGGQRSKGWTNDGRLRGREEIDNREGEGELVVENRNENEKEGKAEGYEEDGGKERRV